MRPLASALTTILTIVSLFALTGWQVTSESASTRLLGRLGAAMIEIDRWLPAHEEDLKLVARDRDASGAVAVRDLPFNVVLPSSFVLEADRAQLRALISAEIGRQLYQAGRGAIRDNEGAPARLGILEPVRWTVFFLSPTMHNLWFAILVLAVLLALAAAAAVLSTGHNPVHAIALGALLGALASLAVWGAMQLLAGMVSDAAEHEIILILRDGAWMGVRNGGGVAFTAGVLAFLMTMGQRRGSAPQPLDYHRAGPPRRDQPFS